MKIQHAAVAVMAITMTTYDVSYYPSSSIVDAFVPSSLTPRVLTSATGMMINKLLSSPTRSNHLHPSSNHPSQHSRTQYPNHDCLLFLTEWSKFTFFFLLLSKSGIEQKSIVVSPVLEWKEPSLS